MKILDKPGFDKNFLIAEISEIQIFSYLSPEEKEEILDKADIVTYDENEKIIGKDEIDPYLYAITQGSVVVRKRGGDGNVVTSSIGRGDIFGEAAIFVKMKRTADVVAGKDIQLFRFERTDILRFLKKYPESGIRLLMIMVYGLIKKLKDAHTDISFDTNKAEVKKDEIDTFLKE
jgi:CRP-like cAMP-binding protein